MMYFLFTFIIHDLCGGLQDLRISLSCPSPNISWKGLLVLGYIQPSRTLSNDNATLLITNKHFILDNNEKNSNL